MSTKQWTAAPLVKRESLALVEEVLAGGINQKVPFERDIVWLRETEAEIWLRHRKNDIDRVSALTDYHGFLTSFQTAVTQEVGHVMQRFDVDRESTLTVEVDLRVCDVPYLVIPESHPDYEAPREGWKDCYWQLPYPCRWRRADDGHTLQGFVVAEHTGLWTSHKFDPDGEMPSELTLILDELRAAVPG